MNPLECPGASTPPRLCPVARSKTAEGDREGSDNTASNLGITVAGSEPRHL